MYVLAGIIKISNSLLSFSQHINKYSINISHKFLTPTWHLPTQINGGRGGVCFCRYYTQTFKFSNTNN